jgi:uncharacterized damage-inducible protein DinB
MSAAPLIGAVLETWRINNRIHLDLVGAIPPKGFAAVPLESRGRDVAAQLQHTAQVRRGWLHYHETGERPKRPPADKRKRPTRAQLKKLIADSGREVEEFIGRALEGRAKVRAFTGNPVRWMGYLISHDAHHRGSIALALKQNGMKLPDKAALDVLWGSWMWKRLDAGAQRRRRAAR